jgi:plasmid stability protein
MTAISIRNLPPETHRALKLRAAEHGRSTEAEVRAILQAAVRPSMGMGSALHCIGQALDGVELDLPRDRSEPEPARFE